MISYAKDDDFDWIYKLHGKNTNLLGAPYPAAIREDIKKERIIINEDKNAFCQFTPMNRNPYSTVHIICVSEEARGKHIASKFLEFIMDAYDSDIQAVCIKDSLSEKFWSSKGKKVGSKNSKSGTELSIYKVENLNKKTYKIDLF